jgi:hypothetical protein
MILGQVSATLLRNMAPLAHLLFQQNGERPLKTVVFLTTYVKLAHYNHDQLRAMKNVNFIVIVKQSEKARVAASFGDIFPVVHGAQDTFPNDDLYVEAKQIIEGIVDKSRPDDFRLVSMSEELQLTTAKLRNDFGLSGMKYEQTLLFRNKGQMKKQLRKSNIRVPHFGLLDLKREDLAEYFIEITALTKLPFIIKPNLMVCSMGVAKIENFEQFNDYLTHANPIHEYGFEEFINGSMYHCDTITQNSNVVFSTACLYNNESMKFQTGLSVCSLPLPKEHEAAQRITQFAAIVNKALGMTHGVTHLEVFDTGEELVFLEIACRAPGGNAVPMYELRSKINFHNINLQLELGCDDAIVEDHQQHVFCGIFPTLPGKVIEKIKPQLESKFDITFKVEIDQQIDSCSSLRDIAASILVFNPNFEALQKDFEKLQEFKVIKCA